MTRAKAPAGAPTPGAEVVEGGEAALAPPVEAERAAPPAAAAELAAAEAEAQAEAEEAAAPVGAELGAAVVEEEGAAPGGPAAKVRYASGPWGGGGWAGEWQCFACRLCCQCMTLARRF